jgi:hypothetical protein
VYIPKRHQVGDAHVGKVPGATQVQVSYILA